MGKSRPSIKQIFSKCASIHRIKVKDEKTIREGDLLAAFSELDAVIEKIGYPAEIAYDLTHSYRHLAFVILLQSFYLQTLKKGMVEIREIYYAFAKQPLKELDEVSYIDLGQLFLAILNTQVIKDAVHELRPFPLRRYADEMKKFKGFLRKIGYSTDYASEVEKKIKEVSRKLFLLQNGFFDIADLEYFQKSLKLKNPPQHEWDQFISKFANTLFNELDELLRGFKDQNGFMDKHRIMLEMAKIVFERQDDLNKAYAFLRESIVQLFVDKINIEVKTADRYFSKFSNRKLEVPESLRDLQNLFSQIGDTRNELQHLGMGKQPQKLTTYEKNFRKHFERLKELFGEDHEDLYQFLQENLAE